MKTFLPIAMLAGVLFMASGGMLFILLLSKVNFLVREWNGWWLLASPLGYPGEREGTTPRHSLGSGPMTPGFAGRLGGAPPNGGIWTGEQQQ